MAEDLQKYLSDINFEKQLEDLVEKLKNKKILVYGAGALFSEITKSFDISKLNIIGISDKRFTEANIGKNYEGYNTIPISSLSKKEFDCILVATLKYSKIINELKKSFGSDAIILPFAPKEKVAHIKFNTDDSEKYVVFGCQSNINVALEIIDTNIIYGVCLKNDAEYDTNDFKNFSLEQVKELYTSKKINGAILPIYHSHPNSYIQIEEIKNLGIDTKDIYVLSYTSMRKAIKNPTKENILNTIRDADNFKELPILKFLLTKHCNLNCAGCSHFAPLVKEKSFLSFEQYKKEIDRMKELFDEVRRVSLLGGEPLLNKNLKEMLLYARKLFPYSLLEIISNGILFPSMDEEFYEVLKKTDTTVYLSKYETTKNLIDKVEKALKEHEIKYGIWCYDGGFCLRYNLSGSNDPVTTHQNCNEKACHTLQDGLIATCYFPITVERANKFFNIDIPWKDSVIDIYDKTLTAEKILKKLSSPMPICAYCGDWTNTEWKPEGKEPKLKEYFVDA